MKQIEAKILKNEKIGPGFYRMRVESGYLAANSKPGQFVEVRCSDKTDPLLRRPIGVNRVVKGGIELLYEVVGKGTEIVSGMKKNDLCDVIGPLGNGFDIASRPGISILVAGGNGVAPLLFLAEELAKKKKTVHVLIGGCSKSHILCEKDFKRSGANVSISTEDGSEGCKGVVTCLLNDLLCSSDTDAKTRSTIYACGPVGMLKAVSRIAHDRRIPCQVSLEERMACGVGACLGCPVKVRTAHTYKMVCKDGPVFNAEEIAW